MQRQNKTRLEAQEIQNSDPDSILEVESLKTQLADCKKQLGSKTIELEKSTQLFSMFDQQMREMQMAIESY